jgi:hypothetical protein
MPDLDQDLPTRNELSWKAMFASTETEREMAKQLLDAGLCRDDGEHALLAEHRFDLGGDAGDESPLGRLISSIVAEQPDERREFESEMESRNDTSSDPPVPLLPVPPESEPLGRSMAKLMRVEPPPELPAKAQYYVAPKPGAAPSCDQMPLSWESFDSNMPI